MKNSLQNVSCPFCAGSSKTAWGDENGFDAFKCAGCGIVYVTPRPSDSAITESNKLGEHQTFDGTIKVVYHRSRRKIYQNKLLISRFLRKEIKSGMVTSWLDIGAGFGELVEAVQGSLPGGSFVKGLEPMSDKVSIAQSLGLPIFDELVTEQDRKYDVISLINVFSHIPDFDNFLDSVKSLLTPGGILIIETGNGGDLKDRTDYPDKLYLPDHLVFAGESHMNAFLSRRGFRVRQVYRLRRDTFLWMIKNIAKMIIGREFVLAIPYKSRFRSVIYKAQLI